jgi:hypothetical protein
MAGIEAHRKKPTTVRVLMWEISASLADRLFALSNVVLILGAAAVLIGTIGAIVMSGVREQFANERISANETATAQATAESDAAKRDAAAATERAALAEQRAAEANLELARFKAPRAISPEQRNRIAEKMKEFTGQEYAGMVASDVGDAWSLWREIGLSLELAGWRSRLLSGPVATQYGPPASIARAPLEGVMIWYSAMHSNHVRAPAEALAKALKSEGTQTGSGPTSDNTSAVIIVIGPKPQQ